MKSIISNFYSLLVRNLSSLSVILILVIVARADLNLQYWNEPSRIIAHDIKGYYAYLPAAIIHGDLDFEFAQNDLDKYRTKLYLGGGPEGKTLLQFTYGMSLLYSPFFLTAHLLTTNMEIPYVGFEADGYTVPYRLALILSCLFYLALGLYFLRKVLLIYFSDPATAITLISITLGTNIFYYSTIEPAMSHVYSFALISIFLYVVIKWLKKATILNTIFLGLIIGIISLVRPNNTIVVLFLIFLGVTGWKSFIERLSFLLRSYRLILLMIFVFLLVWVPQFLYWNYITGDYLFYSYGEQVFFFNNPQVYHSLFSYRKGLLVYIPILVISFTGLLFLYNKPKELFIPTLAFIVINIYILSSWCFWWFGGGYGPRSYIDSYAIMAFPFAAFTSYLLNRNWFAKILYLVLLITLIAHGLFQTRQYRYGSIHWVAMTKEAYWDSFLHLNPSRKYKSLLMFPNYDEAKKGIYYKNDLTYYEMYPDRKPK